MTKFRGDEENDDFIKRFKEHVGMTPTDYINYHRMEASKLILAGEDLKSVSVTEIALEIGYTDPTEYIALFIKQVGMTPEAYRKEQLSE